MEKLVVNVKQLEVFSIVDEMGNKDEGTTVLHPPVLMLQGTEERERGCQLHLLEKDPLSVFSAASFLVRRQEKVKNFPRKQLELHTTNIHHSRNGKKTTLKLKRGRKERTKRSGTLFLTYCTSTTPLALFQEVKTPFLFLCHTQTRLVILPSFLAG